MSNLLQATGGKDSIVRADGAETRIIDSEVLLKKVFDGDPREGCAMLFRLYYSPLFSHAIRFVHSRPVAEDIVAEVFCGFWGDQIFEKISTSYRAYLFKAVRHRAYNYVKFELARKSRNDGSQSPGSYTPNDILEYDELYQLLEDTINKLPQQCKKAFVLSRMENKRYHDIAIELGVSVKAIEGHISRALRVLRMKLDYL
jgi:RNA polymerase sigma-70 factor (ECF subfamily)